jgi:capsular exopolysaccharide synthesis family protein
MEKQVRDQRLRELRRDVANQEEKALILANVETQLLKLVNDRRDKLKLDGKKTNDLEGEKEQKAMVEDAAKKVGTEIEALKVEIQAPQRVRKMNGEESYVVKHEGSGPRTAAIAGAGSFAFVLLGVSYLEFRTRRVRDVTEVSRGLRLPVVGMLPLVRSRSGSGGGQSRYAAWDQLLIESIDAARAVLVHASKRKAFRVVMVTSGTSGEGKTLLSAHLAASLARSGCRTLLIDGDMRRPSLHKTCGLSSQPGLCEALRAEVNIRQVVRPGPTKGLWVIPAGHCDAKSMTALAQGELRGLFDVLRKEYEFIVVDSSPILPVVDTQLLAQTVDGAILSVLRNVSRLPLVYEAYERLMLFQVDVFGVVVHGASLKAYKTDYSYIPVPAKAKAAATKTK